MYESDLLQLVCEEQYSFDIKESINDWGSGKGFVVHRLVTTTCSSRYRFGGESLVHC